MPPMADGFVSRASVPSPSCAAVQANKDLPPASPAYSSCSFEHTAQVPTATASSSQNLLVQGMGAGPSQIAACTYSTQSRAEDSAQLQEMEETMLLLQLKMQEQEALLTSLLRFRAELVFQQQTILQERDAALAQSESLQKRVQELEAAAGQSTPLPCAGCDANGCSSSCAPGRCALMPRSRNGGDGAKCAAPTGCKT